MLFGAHTCASEKEAADNDPGWDFKKGEWILNVRWLKRVRAKVWVEAGEQAIALTSVLPVRIAWQTTTTNQYTLSNTQHEELLHMCRCVKALDPRWKRTDGGWSGAGA